MRSNSHSNSAPAVPVAALTAAVPAAADHLLDETVAQGQQWLKNAKLNRLLGSVPQSVRGLGNQVADRVRRLTPAQQAVGVAVLAFGLGWQAVRSRNRPAEAEASGKYRTKFDGKLFKGRGKGRYASS